MDPTVSSWKDSQSQIQPATIWKQAQVYFVKLSPHATTPTRMSPNDTSGVLYSAYSYTVPPAETCQVKTDIQAQLPAGTWGRVYGQRAFDISRQAEVFSTSIPSSYRGNIEITLYNYSSEIMHIRKGAPIAVVVLQYLLAPVFVEVAELPGHPIFGIRDSIVR